MSDSLQLHGLLPARVLSVQGIFQARIRVGCHFLLQRIILTQGLNPCLLCLLHCRRILYHWTTGEAPIYSRRHQTLLRISRTKMVWEDRTCLNKLPPGHIRRQGECYVFSCRTKDFFFFIVVDFAIHWNETAMGLHVFPIPIPPPTSLSTQSL